MITKSLVREVTGAYLQCYPGEKERLREFLGYLEENDHLFDRKNEAGHITTSAILVQEETGRVLLVAHKSLRRYLQPGGHVEGDATLVASALRELIEETGLSRSAILSPADEALPLDIDVHVIPANPRKGEPEHPHFDFRYHFTFVGETGFRIEEAEVTDAAWFSLDSVEAMSCFGPEVVAKIQGA